jgi:uncharacterized protein (TIGR03083 family)
MWSIVAAERGALAEDLAALTAEQWRTPSLNDGWSVRDTLAHMTQTAKTTVGGFFGGLIATGFNFGKFIQLGVDQNLGATPADTLANFRAIKDSRKAPPGPKLSWLGETIVHAEDIRRPLGIKHDYPQQAVIDVLDFYKTSNTLIGTKSRIAGVNLRATDADWSYGDGPEVSGPLLSLLMAATGRTAALDELAGDGVAILRGR